MNIVRRRVANDNGRIEKATKAIILALQAPLESVISDDLAFGDLETALLSATNELVRRTLEQRLQRLADDFTAEVMVGNKRYRQHHPGTVKYFTLCGGVEVMRWTYRAIGERNGATVVPLELATRMILGATPALAYALAQGHAKAPIRHVEQDLLAAHRRPPSRSTMDRIARELGTIAHESVHQLEPVVRANESVPAHAVAINFGIDRTTIPMEEAADVASPDDPFAHPGIAVNYRMAYVGTVCVTDANCEALWTRRYAAPAHEGHAGLVQRILADVKHALEQRPGLQLGIVQDGAPELWNLLRAALRADPELAARPWRETIDRYHCMDRLAKILAAFFPRDARRRRELYQKWDRWLDHDDYAIGRIDNFIWSQWRISSRKIQKEVSPLLGCYFLNRRQFRYASLRELGLHQGSGVTEGACKSLIAMRAKRSGQRWRERGISAVLALRSLLDSDRLPSFWSLFAKRFEVNCRNAA